MFIHLGDGAYEYFKIKSTYKNIPIVMVKGNCDSFCLPFYRTFNFDGIKMYACHGDRFFVKDGLEKYIEFGKKYGYNIIAYGHTHKRFIQKDENLCIINPGSLSLPRNFGPSYSIITIKENIVEAKIVDYT